MANIIQVISTCRRQPVSCIRDKTVASLSPVYCWIQWDISRPWHKMNYVAEIQSTIPNEQHVSGDMYPSTLYVSGYMLLVRESGYKISGRHVSWCKRGSRHTHWFLFIKLKTAVWLRPRIWNLSTNIMPLLPFRLCLSSDWISVHPAWFHACILRMSEDGWLTTTTESVDVGRMFEFVCLSVCLFVCCPEHNSKTKDPKVLKLGIGNDLGIS